jgi:hypothetical protein
MSEVLTNDEPYERGQELLHVPSGTVYTYIGSIRRSAIFAPWDIPPGSSDEHRVFHLIQSEWRNFYAIATRELNDQYRAYVDVESGQRWARKSNGGYVWVLEATEHHVIYRFSEGIEEAAERAFVARAISDFLDKFERA